MQGLKAEKEKVLGKLYKYSVVSIMNIHEHVNIQQWLACIFRVTNVFNFHINFIEGVVFKPLNV